MTKIITVFAFFSLFQTTLFAENYQTQGNTTPSNPDAKIITPAVGSQYNLKGMQTQNGQHKSSYSTDDVGGRDRRSNSSSNPYGVDGSISPYVPVIVITDE